MHVVVTDIGTVQEDQFKVSHLSYGKFKATWATGAKAKKKIHVYMIHAHI